jgi:hypothetical protein
MEKPLSAQQGRTKPNPPRRRVHVAPDARRIGRLDTQHHKRGRVGLANEPRASSNVSLLLDRAVN